MFQSFKIFVPKVPHVLGPGPLAGTSPLAEMVELYALGKRYHDVP